MRNKYVIDLVTPNGIEFKDFEIEFLKVRTVNGDIGILANHIDYVTVLAEGKLEIEIDDKEKRVYYVDGGFLEIKNGKAIILAEDLIDYENMELILAERKINIDKSIKEKLKEDKDVLGTKNKIRESLKK